LSGTLCHAELPACPPACLQYIEVVQGDKDFYSLWQAVLQALQDCMAVRHEAVQESVPENAKNMLLVLASSSILTPDWKVGGVGGVVGVGDGQAWLCVACLGCGSGRWVRPCARAAGCLRVCWSNCDGNAASQAAGQAQQPSCSCIAANFSRAA